MKHSSPLNFAHRDLRNRSFKGQILNGADFSGADIRGCDFSYALLQGANFERARTGLTPKQLIPLVPIVGGVAWLTFQAFSAMIFASLGTTAAQPAWSYILALGITLAIAGAFSGVSAMIGSQSRVGRVATLVSGAASGALLGFYYGGTTTDNNPKMAIAGAVFGAIASAIAIILVRRRFVTVAVAAIGAVAGYGFAFLVSAIAIAHLSTQKLLMGVVLGSLSVGYIGLTMSSLTLMVREINGACGTSFRGADLTNAKFN